MQLRDYQQSAVDSVRQSFRAGHLAPLVVAPTGSGKTVMFSYISSNASRLGNRVTIVAHRFELLSQISKALERFGVRHGMISPKFPTDPEARVQVASVQTLARRIKHHKYTTDLLIVDEAHHVVVTNSWGQIITALGNPPMLGVTASPIRSDGRGLGKVAGGVFDDLIDVVSVADLIEQAFLVRPVVYAPSERLDLSGLRTRAGDYEREALALTVDKPKITGSAVEHYAKLCPGVTAVAFGVSIKHCEHIAEKFQEAGYNFQVIRGSMEDDVRARLIGGLGQDITGLVSCDLIGEGVDIPAIGCAILMRPTQSMGLHVQQMGRSLRPIYADGFDLSTVDGRRLALEAAGKTKAIILDHVGNTLVHGLPETPREWSLEGVDRKKKKKPSVLVKQCEKCYAVFWPPPTCPQCGHVHGVNSREIEQVAGELEQITPEMAQKIAFQKKREVFKAKTLADLKAIAAQRGYSPGWADAVFRSRERKESIKAEAQARAYGR